MQFFILYQQLLPQLSVSKEGTFCCAAIARALSG
jgi:hypothetical protein